MIFALSLSVFVRLIFYVMIITGFNDFPIPNQTG